MLLKWDTINENVILRDNECCDINIIRYIIKTCPSSVYIKNNDNKTLFRCVHWLWVISWYRSNTSFLTQSTSSSSVLLLHSSNYFTSHQLNEPIVQLLQSTSYDSAVWLHLCGYVCSVESTIRHCIESSITNYSYYNINAINARTIGLNISLFADTWVKYEVFDR